MIKLWGRKSSINVQKVLWTLDELGLEYERIDAGGSYGGLDEPAFEAMNPMKLVPVLDDGGTVIWESHAIIRYLAASYGSGNLWLSNPKERSGCDIWMDWLQAHLQPAFIRGVFWGFFRTPEPSRDWPSIEKNIARTNALFQVLDKHLEAKAYVASNNLTMGDIPAGAQLFRYFNIEIRRPAVPNIERWYERLSARPAYRQNIMVSFEELRGRLSF